MAKRDWHILAREQRLAACVLFAFALGIWLFFAIRPTEQTDPSKNDKPAKKSWAERKDSIRLADSLRYIQWKEEREARYDSVKRALDARHEAYKAELQQWYDSVHQADSLWRDSMGLYFAKSVKKDTILDLNHCDTTELQLIRGIGRYTALRIVQYREALGGYYSPEQLKDEPFSRLSLDTLLHHFTADTADIQLLTVNTLSASELARHPYLRFEQAKAIYTLRRRYVRLTSIDDLRSLPEFSDSTLLRLAPYLSFE